MRRLCGLSRFLALTITISFLALALPTTAADDPNSFSWSTRDHLGNTAARLTLALAEDAECSFGWEMGGSQQEKGGGFVFFYLERTDGAERETMGSSVASAYKSHQVHVGDVDSRSPINVADQMTLFPTGGWGASGTVSGPFTAGTYDFTVGGWDLHSTNEDPEGIGYHALAFDVSCTGAITLQATAASHELMLFSPANMDGGVGVFESLVAQVSLGDSAAFTFTSSQVETHLSWKEYQDGGHLYGQVERTTPDGTVTYDLTDPAEVQIRDTTGPGEHRYVLDRVALDFFSTFSGVAYGLDPVTSLDGLLA